MSKRQSTTSKLSKLLLRQLINFCDTYNCGVILRFRGVEEGYTSDDLTTLLSGFATCEIVPCVRKGWNFSSNECLDAINNFASANNRTTFGACQTFLGLRADSQANIDAISHLAKLAWERLFPNYRENRLKLIAKQG